METGGLKRLADKENLNLRVSLQMKDKMQKTQVGSMQHIFLSEVVAGCKSITPVIKR